MNPVRFIRTQIFDLTQAKFAEVIGVAQATVSRWEGGGAPSLDEMKVIREAALSRGLPWKDELFFEVPVE